MASISMLTRTLARRSLIVDKVLRLKTGQQSMTTLMARRAMSTYYTPAHEYVKVVGTTGTVGITDFAQAALGDIVYIDLPAVDESFEKGDSFGSVESVKAASDVYAPVSGKVLEINESLDDDPGMVNTNAESDAWFIKLEMSDGKDVEGLMDEAAYKEHCEKEAH
mmetsp:Transcript_4244/g.5591  ORF Transcript_4244/g.5591 Transcript_4244/m.5591 type:complete len:165 (-) Transcript_4244:310-804(-)|eukprot:CAMPEP_0198144002 /NCGR_PEP_ID=MMETSP1443-20131203/12349_1 /TAXON_ID=186043 /ORGANISM="Entomoneis sp., Strain CCMP2396" /LENGTH=164 /DNA_ID=CAMNT_0043807319 /DNA_START=69 /DNA_END=563 /DNA_ORIENTATION=+